MRAGLIGRACKQVGIVGLGVGTLAWYGRPWQHFDFFEIDPKVVEIAENKKLFSYLGESKATRQIYTGDARIMLREIPDGKYDLLVVDAYSSDAIPLHLMTVEAFRLYLAKTNKNAVMLFHISNRYFDLAPIIKKISDELGLACLYSWDDPKRYSLRYDWCDYQQIKPSLWVAVSAIPASLKALQRYNKWQKVTASRTCDLWTDDYANLLQAFRRKQY